MKKFFSFLFVVILFSSNLTALAGHKYYAPYRYKNYPKHHHNAGGTTLQSVKNNYPTSGHYHRTGTNPNYKVATIPRYNNATNIRYGASSARYRTGTQVRYR